VKLCEPVLKGQLENVISLDKASGPGDKLFTTQCFREEECSFQLYNNNLADRKLIPRSRD